MGIHAGEIEALIFDYGSVISLPFFGGLDLFEQEKGYPPGSLTALLLGGEGTPSEPVSHEWHRLETGEITFSEYLDQVIDLAPEALGSPLAVEDLLNYLAEMPRGTHWMVVQRIMELKTAGVRLGMLTNNVAEFATTWRSTFPIDELFEVVIDSSAVGLRKPDPEIYLLTCDAMSISPSQALFVDDRATNTQAAAAVGMHVVHFAPDVLTGLAALEAALATLG